MTPAAPERTLPALLERGAARHGAKTLVRFGDDSCSFVEARDRAAALAGGLAAAGVRAGDRVAVLSENRLELLELWLGCAWLGAVLVPINTGLAAPQLAQVLADADPVALAVGPGRRETLAPLGLPSAVWDLDALPSGKGVDAASVGPGDPAAILYTSGTTGPAKGVVCPHAQWYWWAVLTGRVLGVHEQSVLYTNLPLFHTNALNAFCQALVAGATYVLGPRFSASAFWRRAAEAEATVTYLLGPMVSILERRERSALDRAHRLEVALAPATPPHLHGPFRERFGVELVDGWGSTETNVAIANGRGDVRPGTLGRLLPEFDARVADEHDEELPDGTPGELLLRPREPYSFASGYFRRPEATVEAWRNLWFHTGDRVVRDGDGTFRFVDRLKEVIRRRGENVSSWEVEQVLLAHPDVAAAAAFGVPSELGEEEVMAAVVVRRGAAPDPGALARFCEERLAYFAVPRYLEVVSELPLTENGKVEKYRLRERGVTASTWDRERAGGERPRA